MKVLKVNSGLLISLIMAAAVGGIAPPLAKFALDEIPPFGYVLVRLLAGSLIMLLTMKFTHIKPKLNNFNKFAPVATFWWLNALIFTVGLQKTTASTGQFIHISIPVITAILAFPILKERLNSKQWSASLVALIGVAILVLDSGSLSLSNESLIGNILILCSACSFSLYAVLSKKDKYSNLSANEMIFIGSTYGAIVCLVPALIEYHNNHWLQAVSASSFLAMIGAVTAASIFYLGFQKLIKQYGPSVATTNLYLLPVFVVFWSAIILNETISLATGLGALIAVSGVTIFSRFANKKV